MKVNTISSNNPNAINQVNAFNTVSRNFKGKETSTPSFNIYPNKAFSNNNNYQNGQIPYQNSRGNLGNSSARHFFFTTISNAGKMSLNKFDFYLAIVSSNIFTEIVKEEGNYIATISDIIDKLPEVYNKIAPSVNLEQRENYLLWRMIPKEGHCDLLAFLAVEFHKKKLELKKINRQMVVSENLLRGTFEDFGWRCMPSTVINLAKRGFDRLRKKLFSGPEAFRYAFITHIAASQNERGKIFDKNFELDGKINSFRKFDPNIGSKSFAITG